VFGGELQTQCQLAVASIQSRLRGAEAGQLSLSEASEQGAVSLSQDEDDAS
jgi:hypothetical protein